MLEILSGKGYSAFQIDLSGLAYPTEDKHTLGQLLFGSKSRTLTQSRPSIKPDNVPDKISFNVEECDHTQTRHYPDCRIIFRMAN